ncbi:enoyl-CoA hydratase/isomerase family protein [Frankia sp. R82]|uniref:enoyl-CoA hydratase/isomerase family protein n=1 Tax=Frankia sp. R82 TaxID=2950553 RepID=UPI002042D7C6|nr:enoyl-CoA hydratase/isomerase family protein [Frankia sp. R82]MCM3882971.1 enoyl-CoA hydratase/isomerase family protein [Frankia sp. R82]
MTALSASSSPIGTPATSSANSAPANTGGPSATGASSGSQPEVLVSREGIGGALGRLTLNRPRSINALTTTMVETLDEALADWANDPGVAAVLLDGAGERGLCAGGDMRAVRAAIVAGQPEDALAFWSSEYRLNARIRRFPKPYIAIMDGIVMGGGLGLSAHGDVRIVTERSVLAMPEVAIGFVPDVGGTWLLSHAPGELGTHLALTGRHIGPADAITAGLADHYLPSAEIPALLEVLRTAADPAEAIANYNFSIHTPPPGELAAQREWIDDLYRSDNIARIVNLLTHSVKPAARDAGAEIVTKSPTALAVTLRALRAATTMSCLEDALDQEYRIANAALSTHDLTEGIRAALVDKDRTPRWSPARLADVTDAEVDRFFAPAPTDLGLGLAAALGEVHDL